MQIPIISGIYTDADADFRISYPINMRPVVQDTGVAAGYLRPVEGATQIGSDGPGVSRGAINWDGVHYRVMGDQLCSIDDIGTVTQHGSVGDDGKQVTMVYSFDILAIASNLELFYFYPTTVDDTGWTYTLILEAGGFKLIKVTDADLGDVIDVTWVDGYFMTTDGEFLVITELNDPTDVNALKYGSSEIDPDPVVGLVKLRNEIYAVNRYTIEVFDNVGGQLFPFQRIDSAQIQRGALGTHCAIVYEEALAFVGSTPGESPGVYMAANGRSQKISSREIDEVLATFTEAQLEDVVMETVNDKSHALLWIRLPDRTVAYDLKATQTVGQPVWYTMSSGTLDVPATYRPIDIIWCYDKWQCGDLDSFDIGILDDTIASHFGDTISWEFGTRIVYNESRGALFHSLELVSLTGRAPSGESPVISTAYSLDGRTWSQERIIDAGALGDRLKRLIWRRQGNMRNMRMQRFRGDSKAYLAVNRLEVELEALSR